MDVGFSSDVKLNGDELRRIFIMINNVFFLAQCERTLLVKSHAAAPHALAGEKIR